MSESSVELLDRIYALVKEYFKQYGDPVPLKAIAQKWNKRATALGLDLVEALKSDRRFIVDLSRSAAYRVSAAEDVRTGYKVLLALKQNGGHLKRSTLKILLLSQGMGVEAIEFEVQNQISIGSVIDDGEELRLNVSME